MEECIIIVPVYKKFEDLKKNEIISFKQVLRVLGNHPICIVAPLYLESDDYEKLADSFGIKIQKERFDNHFFMNTRGYNDLLINNEFYDRFKKYNYMLIYQLDAYVFRDELLYWCEKGYDYIGAPWFEGYIIANSDSAFIGVGNGGFSIRNIQRSIKVLKKITYLKNIRHLYYRCKFYKILSFARFVNLSLFRFSKQRRNKGYCIDYITSPENFNEDTYWSVLVPQIFTYKVAPLKDALRFSFEVIPKKLYNDNKNELPFGCHAWERYEPEFWAQFIKTK